MARLTILCIVSFWSMPSSAVPVTIGSTTYELATIQGTFPAVAFTLEAQPWWLDQELAMEFAIASEGLLDGFDLVNGEVIPRPTHFAYDTLASLVFTEAFGMNGINGPVLDQAETQLYAFVLRTTEVPLPAAAWFFISAILGLFGVKSLRKLT